jgi:hypothetical protein
MALKKRVTKAFLSLSPFAQVRSLLTITSPALDD